MVQTTNIDFIDNPVARDRRDQYLDITVNTEKVLKSWQTSLYSYEWMSSDGKIKNRDELSETERPKRDEAEQRIKNGEPIEKPILGIGLMENVEIGSGRAIFLTLAASGINEIAVHIPKSNEDEFLPFIS